MFFRAGRRAHSTSRSSAAPRSSLPLRRVRRRRNSSKRRRARRASPREKIDEYGRIGHCDLTARPRQPRHRTPERPAKPAAISSATTRRSVRGQLRRDATSSARSPTSSCRAASTSRASVMRYGGHNDTDDVKMRTLDRARASGYLPRQTRPRSASATTGKRFPGGSKHTRPKTCRSCVEDEMGGPTISDIGQHHFARALKKQPASQGYLVVYTEADELPGAWRRIARREEQSIRDGFELAEGRIRVINGGTADETSVELWIQPKDAPPPVKEAARGKVADRVFQALRPRQHGLRRGRRRRETAARRPRRPPRHG